MFHKSISGQKFESIPMLINYRTDGKTQVTMNGNSLRVVDRFKETKRRVRTESIKVFSQFSDYRIDTIHCNQVWRLGYRWIRGYWVDGRKLVVDNYGSPSSTRWWGL